MVNAGKKFKTTKIKKDSYCRDCLIENDCLKTTINNSHAGATAIFNSNKDVTLMVCWLVLHCGPD